MNQAKICTNCGHKKSEHRQRYDSECCDHRYTLSEVKLFIDPENIKNLLSGKVNKIGWKNPDGTAMSSYVLIESSSPHKRLSPTFRTAINGCKCEYFDAPVSQPLYSWRVTLIIKKLMKIFDLSLDDAHKKFKEKGLSECEKNEKLEKENKELKKDDTEEAEN